MVKKPFGVYIIVILCLIPLLLWFDPKVGIKGSFNPLFIGQACALIGATLLAINFILSSRLKFLEKLFGGLNKVYIIHHLTGSLAIIFLSFHPVLIGLSYLPYSLEAVYAALFPPIRLFAEWFGLLAYLTLALLITLTLYVKLPYHIWKLTHKFMGIALIFAFIHVFLIPSTVASNMLLRTYMLTVMGVGIVTYFYRTLLGRFLVRRYHYKVKNVDFKNGVTKITLAPKETKMPYLPGQFIFIQFDSKVPGLEEHPFSLTSAPNDKEISIAPKISGDYTAKLKNLQPGVNALIEGSFGAFSYLNSPRPKQIWIAGGIGITPFVAMAKTFTKDNGFEAVLYYVTSRHEDAVFLEELTTLSKKLPNLKIVPINTDSEGRLTTERVAKEVADYKKRDIFICGPQVMMKDLRSRFNKLGVRNSHILTEEFSID